VTIAHVRDGDGLLSVYTSLDARVSMLTGLGFEVADAVDALDIDSTEDDFYDEAEHRGTTGQASTSRTRQNGWPAGSR
jgi:hypothetical protein